MKNLSELILAIDLRRSRFGYAVLDGPDAILEWGSGEIRNDGKKRGDVNNFRLRSVLQASYPATVVVRKSQYRGGLDTPLKNRLLRQIKRDAGDYAIPVVMIGRDEIRRAFRLPMRASKYRVGSVIARRFPELDVRLPAGRKSWEAELHGMIVFDAIAAGLAYLEPVGVIDAPE